MAGGNGTQSSMDEYFAYTKRLEERKVNISLRIANISDPIEAIEAIIQNEGNTLNTIWESDSGYPIDSVTVLIVMIPVVLGVIGHYVASQWKPALTGEELYDDFGNRIVEYPRIPIAYLQQTRKDLSAVRENRNSLAWLCHKWLIATNDVVQEIQGPYPLEQPTRTTVPEQVGTARIIFPKYENLQKAAMEWTLQHKRMKKNDLKRQLEARIRIKPLHTLPAKSVFKKAPVKDVEYLKKRIVGAKRLWTKIHQWLFECEKRFGDEGAGRAHPSDGNDSYWTSSETFTSDSGEHWKSYRTAAHRWGSNVKQHAQWKLARGKKWLENAKAQASAAAAAEAAKKKKADEESAAAAAAAAEEIKAKQKSILPAGMLAGQLALRKASSKSKLSSKSITDSNKFSGAKTKKFF